jgi:hypothetical protein
MACSTLRRGVQCEDWQHERTGCRTIGVFLAASLTNQMCMPSGCCKAPNSKENRQHREAGAAHSLLKQRDRLAASIVRSTAV